MTQLFEINVKLSENQKKNLSNAYHKRETIVLRLTKDSLSGSDTLYVPHNIVKRLEKNRKLKKGMDIKLAKTNIRKQAGGSLLSIVLTLERTFGPTIAKTLGLSALAGAASEGASQIVKKISGKGVQTGGFLLPYENIEQILPYSSMLTKKQAQDVYNALQTGSGVHMTPTSTQKGGFIGSLLAGIAAPLVIDAFKSLTGLGAPQMGLPKSRLPRSIPQPAPKKGKGGHWIIPPFYCEWPDQTLGMGIKNKKKAPKKKRLEEKVYF